MNLMALVVKGLLAVPSPRLFATSGPPIGSAPNIPRKPLIVSVIASTPAAAVPPAIQPITNFVASVLAERKAAHLTVFFTNLTGFICMVSCLVSKCYTPCDKLRMLGRGLK